MLGRFKDAAGTVINKKSPRNEENQRPNSNMTMSGGKQTTKTKGKKPEKYVYARPYFLGLDKDEVQLSIDFGMRPILKPRKIQDMPLFAGYAEYVATIRCTNLLTSSSLSFSLEPSYIGTVYQPQRLPL